MHSLRGNSFLAAMAAIFWPGASPAQMLAVLLAGKSFGSHNPATMPRISLSAPVMPSIGPLSGNHRGHGPWITRSPGWRQKQRRKLARRRRR